MNEFAENPGTSIRRGSNALGIPKSTIHTTLKEEKFHPYKAQIISQLLPRDLPARIAFAEEQLALNAADPRHFDRILFSDEALFHLDGGVNSQNVRYWSIGNPSFISEKPLQSPKITAWIAIGKPGLIGLYFFEENVNQHNYLEMLETRFLPGI